MAEVWNNYELDISEQNEIFHAGVLKDYTFVVQYKGALLAALSIGHMMEGMILAKRLDDARYYAKIIEKYARTAIEREHGMISGMKLTKDEAKRWMWMLVYKCRWFLDEYEDVDIIQQELNYALAVLDADAKKPRKKAITFTNRAWVTKCYARLGNFDLAMKYCSDVDGPVDWSNGCTAIAVSQIYLLVLSYLSKACKPHAARDEIVSSYKDLLARLRSGEMDPLKDETWQTAINILYYGMKHFEELRDGKPFTYENLVLSIRYA